METEELESDIDTRLIDLWTKVHEVEDWNLETIAAFMRAAYGRGYFDAVTEPLRGQLMIDHHREVPEIKPQTFPNN
ncbi:hypothetical protein KW801_00325 [Candidatus Saccharibacteria bacterium]|nr:hypothetical protein [Candidatus Saccharibacteria bacterium]